MLSRIKRFVGVLLALSVLVGLPAGMFFLLSGAWRSLESMRSDLSVAVIAAAATVLVSTFTVMAGRYYERKREIEAHFRTSKIEMYDAFLKEFFRLFQGDGDGESLVPFLKEWQRRLVLLGGPRVLRTYFAWKQLLSEGPPDARTMFAMDEFFRALRADIGLSSFGLVKGAFVHLTLRYPELFLSEAKRNPRIKLADLDAQEKLLEAGATPK